MTAPFNIWPHHAYEGVSWIDLQQEIRREIQRRRETFPRLVQKGQLSKQEAEYETEIFKALLEDLGRFEQAAKPVDEGKPCLNPLKLHKLHSFTWHQRRAAITRELDYRAKVYPNWISKGQITQADATRNVQRLTCLRAIYELGTDWIPSNGARPHFASANPTREELEAREQWQIIENDIAARDGRAQEALAL
jgi:hypothetical protein